MLYVHYLFVLTNSIGQGIRHCAHFIDKNTEV